MSQSNATRSLQPVERLTFRRAVDGLYGGGGHSRERATCPNFDRSAGLSCRPRRDQRAYRTIKVARSRPGSGPHDSLYGVRMQPFERRRSIVVLSQAGHNPGSFLSAAYL